MPRHPRRQVVARALVVAAVAGCTTSPAQPPEAGGPTSPATTSQSPSSSTPGTATPSANPSYAGAEAMISVAEGPRGVAFAGGSIWVAGAIGGAIQRVDTATNEVVAEISVALPVTLVTFDGQLWASVLHDAASEADDEIVRIDTAANDVAQQVEVPVFHNIAAGGGAIWAVDATGALRSVDPGTGGVTAHGSVGGATIGIAANDEAVWGVRGDGAIWRRSLADGELREAPLGVAVPGRSRVAVGPGPDGSVWVAVPGTVLAVDPDSLEVRLELSLPGVTLVNDLWVGEGDVWLSANVTDSSLGLNGGGVLRLDPTTAEVRATYRLGPESSGAVVVDGTLWAVDQREHILARFSVDSP